MESERLRLSESEWRVMEALWEAPATLMELVRILHNRVGWAKGTVTTMVRRMEEKGLIRHEAGGKARVYHPALSRDETALAETPEEKEALMGHMFTPMIVGGFTTVTITSVIIAGVFTGMFV